MLIGILFTANAIETGNAQEQEESVTNKNNFTVIALSELSFETLYYRIKNKAEPIQLRNGRRSTPYLTPTADFFEIFTENKDIEDPEKKYKLIGKTQLIRSPKALYFLKESSSKGDDALPLEIYGIDDSKSIFPASSFRFINFTSEPLEIHFNKIRHLIRPKNETIKKVDLSDTGSFTPFILKDIKGKTLGGTRLFSHAKNREMVLIFPPKKGRKRLDIRYYSD